MHVFYRAPLDYGRFWLKSDLLVRTAMIVVFSNVLRFIMFKLQKYGGSRYPGDPTPRCAELKHGGRNADQR